MARCFDFWLDGGIHSADSLRFVNNFVNVHRVPPTDDDEDEEAHSDDLASDKELELSHANLTDTLETRVGDQRLGDENDDHVPGHDLTHHGHSECGMERARSMWAADQDEEACAHLPARRQVRH